MKKITAVLVCLISLLCFAGCDVLGTSSKPETTLRDVINIPEFDQIEKRLSKKGYTVTYTDTAGQYAGKGIICVNGDDYLELYKLTNMEDCSSLMEELNRSHDHSDKSVSLEGSEAGNVVFIGTTNALALADVQYELVVEKNE